MLQVYDGFLESYDELKQHSLTCDFQDIENPADGVVYPNICTDIPADVKQEIFDKLCVFKGDVIKDETIFLRMSPEGVHVPHVAHTDIVMGQYSLMLYLNENELSGTSFLRHIATGISYQPMLDGFVKLVEGDMNTLEAWAPYQRVPAKENRAAIFDAGCIHRADPVGGFGLSQEDSRIVLTCFFS